MLNFQANLTFLLSFQILVQFCKNKTIAQKLPLKSLQSKVVSVLDFQPKFDKTNVLKDRLASSNCSEY